MNTLRAGGGEARRPVGAAIARTVGMCLLLSILILMVYGQAGRFDFIRFDDPPYVTENAHVRSGLSWASFLWSFSFEDKARTYWHPLAWLSHMLDVEMFGLNAGLHHLTNIALHLLNSLILFLGLGRLTGSVWRAFMVAVLFAVHPIQVESVAWVASRKNLLSTTFWLLTIVAYVGYVTKPVIKSYLFLLLVFLMGLLSKPMLVTLPLTLLLLDFWPLKRLHFQKGNAGVKEGQSPASPLPDLAKNRQCLIEKLPLFFLSLLVSWLAMGSIKYSGDVVLLEVVPLGLRIQNALVSSVAYIGKLLWPSGLAVFYPFPQVVPPWQTALSFLLLTGITFFAWRGMKHRPYFMVGWLWFLVTLAPVSGIVQVGLWPAMADRWAYVPSIGLLGVFVWGACEVLDRWRTSAGKVAAVAVATVLVGILSVLSYRQVQAWGNGVTLFRQAAERTENNFIAHNNLGAELYREKRFDEALSHYHQAIRINPKYATAYRNIGIDSFSNRKFEDAEEWFAKALFHDPWFADGHHSMAAAKWELGKHKEAIEHYGIALELNPQNILIYNDLGRTLLLIGQPARAIYFLGRALGLDPRDADANHYMGVAYLLVGKSRDAALHFETALALKPEYAEKQRKLKEELALKSR